MEQFPHLNFFYVVEGKPRVRGGGGNERSNRNKANRTSHADFLSQSTIINREIWLEDFSNRTGLAQLDPSIQPVLIEINPDKLKEAGFDLLDFNIEIVSEGDDGLIVAASLDNLYALEEKIKGFVNKDRGT